MDSDQSIYHIATLRELRAGCSVDAYTPERFNDDGFVHCTATPEMLLVVARDYFSSIEEPIAVMRLAPDRLLARLVYEAPAPIAGGGASHLTPGAVFPHVYGPLNLDAIDGVGLLSRSGGDFSWPSVFVPLEQVLRD